MALKKVGGYLVRSVVCPELIVKIVLAIRCSNVYMMEGRHKPAKEIKLARDASREY
jgi:hypothetical protein